MVFLACLILAKFVPFSFAAPKLGHVLFDPLSYEAAMFVTKDIPPNTSNDVLRRLLRVKDKTADTTKKPCLGYDYDVKLCKLLDDRIICGYNKNLGQPKQSETVIDIGNGCFVRGNRIECGYITGPYPKSERPNGDKENMKLTQVSKTVAGTTTKARQSIPTITTSSLLTTTLTTTTKSFLTTITSRTTPITTVLPTTSTPRKSTTISKTKAPKLTKVITETTAKNSESSTAKPKFMCVDKNTSLFCYEIKESYYFIY